VCSEKSRWKICGKEAEEDIGYRMIVMGSKGIRRRDCMKVRIMEFAYDIGRAGVENKAVDVIL
jgi:hypothetical protein